MCFAPQRRAIFEKVVSKSVPRPSCFFPHFDLEMCFAPQRRAIFWHPNSEKWSEAGVFCTFWLEHVFRARAACHFLTSQLPKEWSEAGVFCTFWLEHVFRATATCHFLTSQLPKVVREWCVLFIFTWKCAGKWLRTRRFSEPSFRPSRPTNHWAHVFCFFCLFLSSTLLFSAFHLSILSEVWLLNFLR